MKKKEPLNYSTPQVVEDPQEGTKPVIDDAGDRMLGGLWGAVVGDALGVPVEFQDRQSVRTNPVTGMRGHGTHHVPAGTWSDDSSLMLCTIESLIGGYDLKDIAERFVRWKEEALWTPYGRVFDIGNATSAAIERIKSGIEPDKSGGAGAHDNGNGSLMRILPAAIAFRGLGNDELLSRVHAISAITHRHPRSQMACGIYCLIARELLKGKSPDEAYMIAAKTAHRAYIKDPYHQEKDHFRRVLNGSLSALKEEQISSGGYVIDTLEASIWCLITTASFGEAVLAAVNLGEDTDTTGCVTGGLAGLCYGLSSVPNEWKNAIARREDIGKLFMRFIQSCE